jgi:hypothetical protein
LPEPTIAVLIDDLALRQRHSTPPRRGEGMTDSRIG